MEHLIDWVQCTFKRRRGEPRVKRMLTAWRSSLYEGCIAISMLQPCGLGCHMLGSCCTTCLGTNLICNHTLQMRSRRAQCLAQAGQVRMTAQNPPVTYSQNMKRTHKLGMHIAGGHLVIIHYQKSGKGRLLQLWSYLGPARCIILLWPYTLYGTGAELQTISKGPYMQAAI